MNRADQRIIALGKINMKTNIRSVTAVLMSKTSKMKPIALDAIAVLMVLFLMTTISCWYTMHMGTHPENAHHYNTDPMSPTTMPVMSQTDCSKLKTLYDRTYVDSLHPITETVDWESLDKIFYEDNKDCT